MGAGSALVRAAALGAAAAAVAAGSVSGADGGVEGARASLSVGALGLQPFPVDTALVAHTVREMQVWEDTITWDSDVLAVSAAREERRCFIKVQGSKDIDDWLHNVEFGKRAIFSLDGAKKHGYGMNGFVKVYANTKQAVIKQVRARCSLANDTVVVTGHSRGGAVAQVFSAALFLEGIVPPERLMLITFGSPRVLRGSLSDRVHGKYVQLRLVNRADPVPSLPYPVFGYRHIGEMRCNECGYDELRDSPSFSARLTEIGDHFLAAYVAWLQSLS